MTSPIAMKAADRGILIGKSGYGKSTAAEYVLRQFRQDYPDARIAIADTKPRWRGTRLPNGSSTRRLYKHFVKGDTIPGAMSMANMDDWPLAWNADTNPSRTVIAQRPHDTDANNLRFQVAFIEKFFQTQRADTPSLLYIDEGMDFYFGNAAAKAGSDIVRRCFRAGRERNLATLIGVQRPVSIDIQTMTEANWAALFHIRFQQDMTRMYEMGWPRGADAPGVQEKYVFRLWNDQLPNAPKFRLVRDSQAA